MELNEKWLKEIEELWPFAKGSVREYRQKCSKKECSKCKTGERHLTWQMTYYENGRQRSKHVPRAHIEELKKAIENGRKVEEILIKAGLEYLEFLKDK